MLSSAMTIVALTPQRPCCRKTAVGPVGLALQVMLAGGGWGRCSQGCGVHSQCPGSHPLHPESWGGGLRAGRAPGHVPPGARGRGGTRRLPVTLPRAPGPSPPPGTWEPIPAHDFSREERGWRPHVFLGPQTEWCQRSQGPADCKSEFGSQALWIRLF